MSKKFTLNKCLKMLKEYNDRILKISEEAVKEVFKDLEIPEVDIQGRKIVRNTVKADYKKKV